MEDAWRSSWNLHWKDKQGDFRLAQHQQMDGEKVRKKLDGSAFDYEATAKRKAHY